MEFRKLLATAYSFVFIVCLWSFPAGADEAGSKPNITETEFVISYDVEGRHKSWVDSLFKRSSSQKSRTMKLWVNLPQTIPGKQEIVKMLFQPKPSRHFKKNGNAYVEYQFDVPTKTAHFEIIVHAKIIQRNLATIMHSGSATTEADPNLDPYLVHERMIEKDHPLIQELASKTGGQNRLDTIKEIYHFVPTYLSIDLMRIKGVGAAKAAEAKKGKCIDYCDLFVALCRAKGIPARVAAGFKCDFTASPKHSWTEVYVEPYGWISLDPTILPNVPPAAIDDRFYNYRLHFLKFTSIRNDTVLHYNYFYSYPFWDKELMKNIRGFETIEFIKPKPQIYSSKNRQKRARQTQRVVDEYIEKQQKTKTVQK